MRIVPSVCLALATGLATGVAGCQHPTDRPDHCSGDVAALGDRTGTLHVRAELSPLSQGGQGQRHEAVVQIRPEAISLVGLTPMGTQAFELTRNADGLTLENRVGRFLGMTPRLLYDAVARGYLASGAPGAGGERLLETWHAGRRERRRFLPLSERDRGEASVSYERPAGAAGPVRAVVRNEWCDYEARIVVVSDDRPDAATP